MAKARTHKRWGRIGSPHSPVRKAHLRKIAPKGGKATLHRYGKAHLRKIGKRGASVRWGYMRSPLRNPFL